MAAQNPLSCMYITGSQVTEDSHDKKSLNQHCDHCGLGSSINLSYIFEAIGGIRQDKGNILFPVLLKEGNRTSRQERMGSWED